MPCKPTAERRTRIMVVAADPFVRSGICGMLVSRGFDVVSPEDGTVAALADSPGVDLIVASPSGVGAPVGRWTDCRPASAPLPVIALVDHANWSALGFLDVANAMGAAAVLQTPCSSGALLRAIEAVLTPGQPRDAGVPMSRTARPFHRMDPLRPRDGELSA